MEAGVHVADKEPVKLKRAVGEPNKREGPVVKLVVRRPIPTGKGVLPRHKPQIS